MTHPRKAVSAFSIRLWCMAMAAVLISGCSTIMNRGRNAGVLIESDPAGAEVFIDNVKVGKTPLDISIAGTSGVHRIQLCMDGYKEAEAEVSKRMDPWVWGNVPLAVFPVAALTGLAIDAYGGKWFRYEPDLIQEKLEPVGGNPGPLDPFWSGRNEMPSGSQPRNAPITPSQTENDDPHPPQEDLISNILEGNK